MNIISYLVYFYLNYIFTVKINYANPYEQITGMFVIMLFGWILDRIAFVIAYSTTGSITTRYDSPNHRSFIHWTIRAVLWGIILVLGITGIYSAILTPIIRSLTTIWKNYIDWIGKSITDAILSQQK